MWPYKYQLVLACILNLQFCKIWSWDQTVTPSGLNPLKHFIYISCTKDVCPLNICWFHSVGVLIRFQPKRKVPLSPAEITLLPFFSFSTSIFPCWDAQIKVLCLPDSVSILNSIHQQPGWSAVRPAEGGVCVFSVGLPQSLAEPLEWSPSISVDLVVRLVHCTPSATGLTAKLLSKIHFIFKVSVPSVSLWYLFLKGAVKLLCFYHSHSLI